VYESESVCPSARSWLRMLMAMSMLPTWAVPLAWNSLREPFPTGNPSVDAKLRSFASYYESKWISGDFSPQLRTLYDHLGPRTTNLAEGFHNSLNTRFGVPHPSLRTFLDWLQKCQYETQCRVIQLTAGRPPKQKAAEYVQLEANVQSVKLKYGLQIGHIFSVVFPHPAAWPQFYQSTADYLAHISYLIGA